MVVYYEISTNFLQETQCYNLSLIMYMQNMLLHVTITSLRSEVVFM